MKVALIGDFDASVIAHQAIPIALAMTGLEAVWIHTATVGDAASTLASFAGIWANDRAVPATRTARRP